MACKIVHCFLFLLFFNSKQFSNIKTKQRRQRSIITSPAAAQGVHGLVEGAGGFALPRRPSSGPCTAPPRASYVVGTKRTLAERRRAQVSEALKLWKEEPIRGLVSLTSAAPKPQPPSGSGRPGFFCSCPAAHRAGSCFHPSSTKSWD